ncbi:hypothetical protein AB0K60_16550 [Thermopolyspora sp. NPDC052614]|uniref:hypothetical protein n=1 Tax=Thermopolyspora sp. NPDC052614 TaxID=3155682 RepID=UPI0034395144
MTTGSRGAKWLGAAVAALVVAPQMWAPPAAALSRAGDALAHRAGTARAAGPVPPQAAAAAGRTFYVDSAKGSDAAAGTSPATAWRSLDKANEVDLKPGDRLLFKRGGSWKGTLTISARGTANRRITIGAYGTGPRPKISGRDGDCVIVTGSYIRVTDLRASDCQWAGFQLRGDRNELVDVYADRNIAGVLVASTSSHNVIRDSAMIGNNRMSVNDEEEDNDSGAFGILLNGDDNLVTGNLITGSFAKSRDYVFDGAAVEVYNGDRNTISFNVSRDNETFTELGHEPGRTATGNLFVGNVVTSAKRRGSFLITRGPRNDALGPVWGTVAVHNSVYLTARDTIGVSCYDGCSPKVLKLRNNVIKVGGVTGDEDGSGIDDGGGVYWGRVHRFKLGPRSVRADPRFRSRTDLRLRPGSPALGRGLRLGPSWYGGPSLVRDISGAKLSRSPNPDAGAFQQR